MQPPIILSAKRTGSTIVQNIVHILLNGTQGAVEKKHKFESYTKKVIVPIRDPRDTAISYLRTIIKNQQSMDEVSELQPFKDSKIKDNLELMVELYTHYKVRDNGLILRYENIHSKPLGDYTKITKSISQFLGIDWSEELNERVHEILDINKMKEVSDELESFKRCDNKKEEPFYIHGFHIEKTNKIGWREKLDSQLQKSVSNLYREYIKKLDYPL